MLVTQLVLEKFAADFPGRLNAYQKGAYSDAIGDALASPELRNLRLRVAGHTDDQGEPSYNMDLSERRAATVARYLEENFLISIDRLEIIGMGEETPLVNETTLEARRLNRRVEIRALN